MPPVGQPRPGAEDVARLLAWVEATVGPARAGGLPDPGRVVPRRLNNREYANCVRDLFGVDFPAREVFPSDPIGHGFDTVGEAFSVSDELFEAYLDAAERIARDVFPFDPPGLGRMHRYGAAELQGRGGGDPFVLATVGDALALHEFPRAGRYRVEVTAFGQQAGPETTRMGFVVDGRVLHELEVAATQAAPATYAHTLDVTGGEHAVGARFLNDYYQPQDPDPARRDRNLHVVSVEVIGPLGAPPLTETFVQLLARHPDAGDALARRQALLADLARRVWRRPATRHEVLRLDHLTPVDAPLVEVLHAGLVAMLSSPAFLVRFEPDERELGAGGPRPLGGYELASRLSFFLWSSTPDGELLDAAESGALDSPQGRAREVERLLADPRSRALADGFAAQWLQLTGLEERDMDVERFPTWSAALARSMREESLATFEALLREDRSLWELIDGDTTLVDERLARHYGIPAPEGGGFRRVSLAATERRGVLGHASVLAATSNPTRTSPVQRGKWVLDVLLGAPPPPPPPGVGDLDESPEATAAASLRERLELHRAHPDCAACHAAMDPLGFGLERFDAVGRRRERDGEHPVDASGELPDGRRFDGPRELAALLRQDDAFLRNLARRILVYALGRDLERVDRPTVEALLAGLDPEHPTLRQLVHGVAASLPFTHRR
jgi:hypothetical protein